VQKINDATLAIEYGRKGFATRGKAEEGRISYERGISMAFSAFKDAQSTSDPKAIILIEYTFLLQELAFCVETDNESKTSLSQAVKSFDEAFLVLDIVGNSASYKIIDKGFPSHKDFRVKKIFPKDSFNFACGSHKTRLQNILRSPGIDQIEKTLLKQRIANLATAQKGYIEKQRKALT